MPRVPWPIKIQINNLYVTREVMRCSTGVIVELVEFEDAPQAMLLHSEITVTRRRSMAQVLGKGPRMRVLRLLKHSKNYMDMSLHGMDQERAKLVLARYRYWKQCRREGYSRHILAGFNWNDLRNLPELVPAKTQIAAMCTGPEGILGIKALFKGIDVCYAGNGVYEAQSVINWRELIERAGHIEGMALEQT